VTGEETAFGVSFWLLPQGSEYERLAARIHALATLHGSTPFPPHVTLLGGIRGDETAILTAAGRFAKDSPALPVRLVAASVRDEYFRRLVLEAHPTEELMAARARAAASLALPATGFEPHLSLLYGRAEVVPADAGVQLPLAFTCRQLAVWRTQGAASAWRPLGTFLLGSAETT
jgi:hypothetical protein